MKRKEDRIAKKEIEQPVLHTKHNGCSQCSISQFENILHLQQTIGNQTVRKLHESKVVQTNLTNSSANDNQGVSVPEPLAVTRNGHTSFSKLVCKHPLKEKIEAHEAIHRVQCASRGLVPYGNQSELEAEASLGAVDLLAGRTVKTNYAAAPGQRLNYETEKESEIPAENQQGFPEKTNVAIDVTVRWHDDRFAFREELVEKILGSRKLRAQARKIGGEAALALESAIDTRLAWQALAGEGPSLSGYREGDKVHLLVVVTLTPYASTTFPVFDIAVLQPQVQIEPPRFPRIEKLEALEKALMDDCLALMDQVVRSNTVLEAGLAKMETGAWLATAGGISVVPHPAAVILGMLADLIILYSTGDERMNKAEAMFALRKPAVELPGEAGLTAGEIAAKGEKATLPNILKSMVRLKDIPPGGGLSVARGARLLGIAAKAFGPLISIVVWIYKIETFFEISREFNDQLNKSLSLSWRLEANIRLIEEARRERERLEALRR